MPGWRTAVAATTVAVALLVAGFAVAPEGAEPEMVLSSRERGHGYGPVEFGIDGVPVTGLYPGKEKRITVTVSNPTGQRMRVDSLGGRLAGTSREGCPATEASLKVGHWRGSPVVVAPRSRVRLRNAIPVVMPAGASPKCASTTFRIVLSGTGSRAGR